MLCTAAFLDTMKGHLARKSMLSYHRVKKVNGYLTSLALNQLLTVSLARIILFPVDVRQLKAVRRSVVKF